MHTAELRVHAAPKSRKRQITISNLQTAFLALPTKSQPRSTPHAGVQVTNRLQDHGVHARIVCCVVRLCV